MALLEIGASAGLNLAFDAYAYRVAGQVAGPEGGASVMLSAVPRGGGPVDGLLGVLPAIEYRMGADLDPVDVGNDPEAARWLEAFIWPEQVEELAVPWSGSRPPTNPATTSPGDWPKGSS